MFLLNASQQGGAWHDIATAIPCNLLQRLGTNIRPSPKPRCGDKVRSQRGNAHQMVGVFRFLAQVWAVLQVGLATPGHGISQSDLDLLLETFLALGPTLRRIRTTLLLHLVGLGLAAAATGATITHLLFKRHLHDLVTLLLSYTAFVWLLLLACIVTLAATQAAHLSTSCEDLADAAVALITSAGSAAALMLASSFFWTLQIVADLLRRFGPWVSG